ncbi:MAG TPA: translation initiation factor IF-3 [Chloroflexi bacterium]|nr:translation initiation factor IF-3 [Chloroflexota bacterium]
MNSVPGGRKSIVKDLPVNRRIRAKEVRLIGEDGEQLGVVPLQKALQIAYERGLDLVQVASTMTPPVCRILDYGKYKYEQTKKERKAKRGQRVGLLKEVRLRPKIEEHDLQAKIKTTKKLLEEGNKVRLVLRFRGREVIYPELGWKVLRKVAEASKESAVITSSVNDARSIAVVLSPVPQKKSKGGETDAKT